MAITDIVRSMGWWNGEDGLYITTANRCATMPYDIADTVIVKGIDETVVFDVANEMRKRFPRRRSVAFIVVSGEAVAWESNVVSDPIEGTIGDWESLWSQATAVMEAKAEACCYVAVAAATAETASPFSLEPLRDVVAALRAPDGCPWDKLQTHSSLRRYLLEEVYELLEAIDNHDAENLREELGDVLLQIVFHARLAEEAGLFTVQDVIDDITAKMIRRHPHVFSKAGTADIASTVLSWDALKAQEKGHQGRVGLLDGISKGLPALLRAQKLQEKAAKVGFDWDAVEPIWAKLYEEITEFKEALALGDRENAELEAGDVLFSLINLLRWYKIGGENALNRTNTKFYRRFSYVEQCVRRNGKGWDAISPAELDSYWEAAKVDEKSHSV